MCCHTGHPWTDEMIAVAWKHDVYIDISAYLPRYYPPRLQQFLRTYGQDKVLFPNFRNYRSTRAWSKSAA